MDTTSDDDVSDELSNQFMRSFEEYDDDSIIIHEIMQIPQISNPATQMLNNVLLDRAKFNKSYTAASAHCKSLNAVPGALLRIPTNKIQMKREADLKYTYDIYIFCDSCKLLYKKGKHCEQCRKSTKKRKDNYFISIPIKQQILHTIDKHLDVIINLARQERQYDVLQDVFDSILFMNVSKKSADIILPLTINVDGAKIFNSSKSTLWPIQLVQNYLPANLRFLRENMIIVGLYCGQKKPDIPVIMSIFAQEMQTLQQDGIYIWNKNELLHFSPTVLFCACDLPARADVQNCKPSGYYGCSCCLQEGSLIKNKTTGKSIVRFLKASNQPENRTHKQALTIGYDVLNGKVPTNTKGLKGLSCMIAFKEFDLVNSFTIDYMHGVCIGIVPLLLDIWLGKKKLVYEENESYRFKKLNVQKRLEFNRRIMALKPSMKISHKPRSILERSFYTANEFRSLLFYYLRFAVYGLLKNEIIQHFCLLSEAIYTLFKNRITKDEVARADQMLNKFADQFELFYGRSSITINIHMLRHYSNAVINTGPLWCTSMLCFESNMGTIKRSFNCSVHVVEQIAFNYSLRASEIKIPDERIPQILRLKQKKLTLQQKETLNDTGFNVENDQCEIGYELYWKKQVFKSTSSIATKSIDHFVELIDGSVGSIDSFLQLNGTPHVLVKSYDIVKRYNHLKSIRLSQNNEHRLVPFDSIRQKLIYLKYTFSNVSFIEIITSEPNCYEGN